jgi:RNA polymerase sigma-70 factor, ECF subfamily
MRRYARALTRNSDFVDDLVQDCVERALTRQHLWQRGTNLRAWLFTMVHNQYVDRVRYEVHRGVALTLSDAEPLLMRSGGQEARHALRDFDRALAQLPEQQRTVILLIGIEGMSYEGAAEAMGCPVGTVRSRLCRGRETLHRLMGVSKSRTPQPSQHECRQQSAE